MKILLIDDEKELVTTLSERLMLRGVENDWAVSGEEGLALIDQNTYDWVVVDLKMPGMGGLEAIRAIRSKQPQARIILLTGHNAAEDLDHALDLGADNYLIKPVDINELLAAMQPENQVD